MNGSLFSAKNMKILAISFAALIAGYILLGQGPINNHLSWSVAPIILVVAYCFLIPWAIIAQDKKEPNAQKKQGV
jgi:phosphotransferase system  glucose/maltose/N-acetylglucosamine-specific IIC component